MVLDISLLASHLLSLLGKKITDLGFTEIGHIWNVDDNLRTLITDTQFLQSSLNQLGDNELPEDLKPWLQDVCALFYNVDDIIDGIMLGIMRQRIRSDVTGRMVHENAYNHQLTQNENEVRGYIWRSLKKWGLPRKISDILKRFQKIERHINILIHVADARRNRPSSSASAVYNFQMGRNWMSIPSSSNHLQYPLTRSREEDKMHIITKLCSIPPVSVCIVGMSGLGKTTLTRFIQHDAAIEEHFGPVIWSGTRIIGSAMHGYPVNIQYQGGNGNLLIVLDDLWNVSYTDWDKFVRSFPSKPAFLITTRNPKVASITSTTPHPLQRLSDVNCERLLVNMLPKTLVYQYRPRISSIARKSAGLPLVANFLGLVIGNILDTGNFEGRRAECNENEPEEALSTLERRDLWEWKVFQDEIVPALRFNDPTIPPELSKLLAYLPLFPYDYHFKKDELLQLWMAEGFITPEDWSASCLENAGNYFDQLLSRSLLHLSSNSSQAYKIHEFTHRFAQSIASNMCYQMSDTVTDHPVLPPTRHTRHLSICYQNIDQYHLKFIQKHYHRLRTFLLLPKQRTNIHKVPESFFRTLHYLRVVSLGRSFIASLPRSVKNLKHLRYLDASETPIQSLPDTICDLLGLRIIRLMKCPNLLQVPNNFSNLVNLFYFDIDMTHLRSLPPCIGSLTNLQKLDVFIVKNTEGHRINELKNMNCLRGSLKIKELENVRNTSEAENAKLNHKAHLKKLALHWTRNCDSDPSAKEILNVLRPSDNLKELWLENYIGVAFPSWFSSPSCHLKIINLYNCPYISKLPSFWKLPDLVSLSIESAHSLVSLGWEYVGDLVGIRFPKLKSLQLQNMKELARWEYIRPGDMPSLCDLKLINCPQLSVVPALHMLTSLKTLQIVRCPRLEDPKLPLSVESYIF